jgi:hypothetical protein
MMCILPRVFGGIALGICLAAIVGCGGDNRAAVQGKVTLDGRDIEGTISFVPTDGRSTSAAWGEIKEGCYSLPAARGPVVGTYRVEISWMRKTGKKQSNPAHVMFADEIAEAIPTRYNRQSELQAEIKPEKNQVDFNLTSK